MRGYRGDSLIFTNTTALHLSPRNVSASVQTDRSRYQPGDTVKLRVVCVQVDNRPYKGSVDVSVRVGVRLLTGCSLAVVCLRICCLTQDPSGTVVDRWESTGKLGIVLQEFTLSRTPLLGQWKIMTTVNVWLNDRNVFTCNLKSKRKASEMVSSSSQGVTDARTFIVELYGNRSDSFKHFCCHMMPASLNEDTDTKV